MEWRLPFCYYTFRKESTVNKAATVLAILATSAQGKSTPTVCRVLQLSSPLHVVCLWRVNELVRWQTGKCFLQGAKVSAVPSCTRAASMGTLCCGVQHLHTVWCCLELTKCCYFQKMFVYMNLELGDIKFHYH